MAQIEMKEIKAAWRRFSLFSPSLCLSVLSVSLWLHIAVSTSVEGEERSKALASRTSLLFSCTGAKRPSTSPNLLIQREKEKKWERAREKSTSSQKTLVGIDFSRGVSFPRASRASLSAQNKTIFTPSIGRPIRIRTIPSVTLFR